MFGKKNSDINEKELEYAKKHFNEVLHTTLNLEGPGFVRIHLIPPKIIDNTIAPSIAIINGQDIIPINRSWTILLSEFIREVNKYEGHEVSKEDVEKSFENIYKTLSDIYPKVKKKRLEKDIYTIMNTFVALAKREPVNGIKPMTLSEYAPYMKAPHRMDLIVSSLTKNGAWHCNNKCIHCYACGQPLVEEDELSTEDWKKIIDKLREIGIPQLTFTGGEPTLRDDLPELIKYARWFVTRLNTNGINLTKEYCKELKDSELDSVQITLYSYDEDIHNKLVGAPTFKKTIEGIKNALEVGLNVSVNTPICKDNSDYVATLDFLKNLGVEYTTCSGLLKTGNALTKESETLELTKEELSNLLDDAILSTFPNGPEMAFTSPSCLDEDDTLFTFYGLNRPTCGACLSNMAITPSGKVVPCQSDLSGTPLGDILKDSWEDIWNSELCTKRRAYSCKQDGTCPLKEGINFEEN